MNEATKNVVKKSFGDFLLKMLPLVTTFIGSVLGALVSGGDSVGATVGALVGGTAAVIC